MLKSVHPKRIFNINDHVTKYWPLIGREGKGRFLTPVRWYEFDP